MAIGKRTLRAIERPIEIPDFERQVADALGSLISDKERCARLAWWELRSSTEMLYSPRNEGAWGRHALDAEKTLDAVTTVIAYSRTKLLTERDKDGAFFNEDLWRHCEALGPALEGIQDHLIRDFVEAKALDREEAEARPAYRKGALYVRLDQLADRWASLGGMVSAGTSFKAFAIAATAPLWGAPTFPKRALTTAIGNFKKRQGEPPKPGNPLITPKAKRSEKL